MIESKLSIRSILKSPRTSLSPTEKKVSFNQQPPSQFNFEVLKSQSMRAGVYDKFRNQQVVFQKIRELDQIRAVEHEEKERRLEQRVPALDSNSLKAIRRSNSRLFKSGVTEGENSPNVSLELSNSSRLSVSQIQDLIMKKELANSDSLEASNKQNIKGKVKALHTMNIFQKQTASPQKKKMFEGLALEQSLINRSLPENENRSNNISGIDNDNRQTKSELMERLMYPSKLYSPSKADETRSRIINIAENDELNLSRNEKGSTDGLPENLKTEQELERSTKNPLFDLKANINPNVNLDYVLSSTKKKYLELSDHKLQAGRVMISVIQNFIVNKVISHMSDAFEAIKREYLIKANRRKRYKGGLDLLDYDKFNRRKLTFGFFKLYDHMHVESLRYEYAVEYHLSTMLNKAFRRIKKYAIRKINNERLIKENLYRNELRIKKKTLGDISTYAVQSKEAIMQMRGEFAKLKNFKIIHFWQKYARKKKIKRKIKETRKEQDEQVRIACFHEWKNMISSEVTEKLRISKEYRLNKVNRVFFNRIRDFYVESIEKKRKNAIALLYRKNLVQKKFFSLFKFEVFERGKRQIIFDKDEDYLQLKICVKDKVSKTIYKNNNFAVISNEKSITIDMAKRGLF